MKQPHLASRVRSHRKRSGLSQKDLARIVALTDDQISRHERSVSPPTLVAAFGYQVVFQKPVSEMFPGLFHTIESGVVERIESFERDLSESAAKGRAAAPIARRLEWLYERKNSELE